MTMHVESYRAEDDRAPAFDHDRHHDHQHDHQHEHAREVALAKVSEVLENAAPGLTAAETLAPIGEALRAHLALASLVLFKRVAGQSRTFMWATADVGAARRLAAREDTWREAAELIDEGPHSARISDHDDGHRGKAVTASVEDADIGLSALLRAESTRTLDVDDARLVQEVLRRMLSRSSASGLHPASRSER